MKPFDLVQSPLEGAYLIEACAGTGKTYAIAFLTLRLLIEKELKIGEILVLTYTNNATDELRERIRSFIQKGIETLSGKREGDGNFCRLSDLIVDRQKALRRLKDALRDFDEVSVFTIHSFCHQVLTDFSFESGISNRAEIEEDDEPVKRELFLDFWRRHFYELPVEILAAMQSKRRELFEYIRDIALQFPRDEVTEIKIPEGNSQPPPISPLKGIFEEIVRTWHSEKEAITEEINKARWKKPYLPKREMIVSRLSSYLEEKAFLPFFMATEDFLFSNYITKQDLPLSHRFFRLIEDFQDAKDQVVPGGERYLNHLVRSLYETMKQELPKIKRRVLRLSFDDLLLELQRSIADARIGSFIKESVQKKYRAALIDEFQDTDPVQYKIIASLFGERGPLFLIGDPRQAIYSFRGADLFTYVTCREGLEKNHIFTLTTNYRAVPHLLEAVNKIFSRHPNPFGFQEIGFTRSDAGGPKSCTWPEGFNASPFQIWYFGDDYLESHGAKSVYKFRQLAAAHLAAEVGRLIEAGAKGEVLLEGKPLEPGDIVILVRKRYDAYILRESLAQAGIKSVFQRMGPLFDTEEAKECLIILKAIWEPHRGDLLKAALSTEIMGKTALEIVSEGAEGYFPSFYRYRSLWEQAGFLPMFREFLKDNNVRPRLLGYQEGERKLTNVLHLGEVLHEREAREKLLPAELIKWLNEKIKEMKKTAREYELRLESDEGAVVISTVHGAKGLEFPVVFCPFLWIPVMMEKEGGGFVTYHEKTTSNKWHRVFSVELNEKEREISWLEAFAEECRLLYVALTRAIYRCYLFWGRVPEKNTSPLAYLLHWRNENISFNDLGIFMEASTEESRLKDLLALSQEAPECIHVSLINQEPGARSIPMFAAQLANLQVRTPPSVRDRLETNVSFSLLAAKREEEDKDYWDLDSPAPLNLPPEDVDPIFLFPSGARAGVMIHHILERLDYGNLNKRDSLAEIVEGLGLFGFSVDWVDPIWRMIERVLNTPLLGRDGKFCLSQIRPEDRLTEMSFTLPLEKVTGEKLLEAFAGTSFAHHISKLSFPAYRGFLRGFMDLVFRYRGRYYLLDWKTNHLGYSFEDYAPDRLEMVMYEHLYFLQYHLYLVALHRHLKKALRDYDYEKHVGGVFYIFTRGVNPDHGIGTGIFKDLPPVERIERLEKEILAG